MAASASAFTRFKRGFGGEALLHFVPAARDAAASSVAEDLRQKAAIGAAKTMEVPMRVLSIKELMRLTRFELIDLSVRITHACRTCRKDRPTGKSRSSTCTTSAAFWRARSDAVMARQGPAAGRRQGLCLWRNADVARNARTQNVSV
jgi:hypothetical protein